MASRMTRLRRFSLYSAILSDIRVMYSVKVTLGYDIFKVWAILVKHGGTSHYVSHCNLEMYTKYIKNFSKLFCSMEKLAISQPHKQLAEVPSMHENKNNRFLIFGRS